MVNTINEEDKETSDEAFEGDYEPRFHGYHDLMRNRIREILLVSSLYDAFTLEEDTGLSEQIFGEYHDLELSSAPRVIRVSTANEALLELKERKYDLIITMTHLIDLDPIEFGKKIKELKQDAPVVLLVTDVAELQNYHGLDKSEAIDKIFYWNGDSALFLAIIKYFEDKWNLDTDSKKGMVGVILVIEDSYRYYSMFLPLIT
jgi:CheY-like chemotaxis protein